MRKSMIGIAAALAIAGSAAGIVASGGSASAGTLPASDPAACAAASPYVSHQMGHTGLTWRYVRAATARELGISRCSILLIGSRETLVVNPRGNVVAKS
jgi:hypothetical protein